MEFGSGEDKLHGGNSGVTLPTISPRQHSQHSLSRRTTSNALRHSVSRAKQLETEGLLRNELIRRLEETGRLRGRFNGSSRKDGYTIAAPTRAAELFNLKMREAMHERHGEVENRRRRSRTISDDSSAAILLHQQSFSTESSTQAAASHPLRQHRSVEFHPDLAELAGEWMHQIQEAEASFSIKDIVQISVKKEMLAFKANPEQWRKRQQLAREAALKPAPKTAALQRAPTELLIQQLISEEDMDEDKIVETAAHAVAAALAHVREEELLVAPAATPAFSSGRGIGALGQPLPSPTRRHASRHRLTPLDAQPQSGGGAALLPASFDDQDVGERWKDGGERLLSIMRHERSMRVLPPSTPPGNPGDALQLLPGPFVRDSGGQIVSMGAAPETPTSSAPGSAPRRRSPLRSSRKPSSRKAAGLTVKEARRPSPSTSSQSGQHDASAAPDKAATVPAAFLDSIAAERAFPNYVPDKPGSDLLSNIERLHRLHNVYAEQHAQAVAAAKSTVPNPSDSALPSEKKRGKGRSASPGKAAGKKGAQELPRRSVLLSAENSEDPDKAGITPPIRAGAPSSFALPDAPDVLRFLSVHDPAWRFSVVSSKFPRADPSVVHTMRSGLEEDGTPDWMRSDLMAVPIYRQMRRQLESTVNDLLRYVKGDALRLPHSGVSGTTAKLLKGSLPLLQHIKTLDLTDNSLGDAGASDLVDGLFAPDAPALAELNLTNCGLGWAACQSLSRLLLANKPKYLKLQTLLLPNNKLGNRGISILAEALGNNCCRLSCLDISRCGLSDGGACSVGHLINYNNTVTKLWVADNHFRGDSGGSALMEGLSNNTCLKELDLQGCALHGRGAARVAAGIAASDSLCSLDISRAEVDATAAPAIADMLASCTSLLSVFCRGNPISAEGAHTIIRGYLRNGGSLRDLDLSGCAFIKIPETRSLPQLPSSPGDREGTATLHGETKADAAEPSNSAPGVPPNLAAGPKPTSPHRRAESVLVPASERLRGRSPLMESAWADGRTEAGPARLILAVDTAVELPAPMRRGLLEGMAFDAAGRQPREAESAAMARARLVPELDMPSASDTGLPLSYYRSREATAVLAGPPVPPGTPGSLGTPRGTPATSPLPWAPSLTHAQSEQGLSRLRTRGGAREDGLEDAEPAPASKLRKYNRNIKRALMRRETMQKKSPWLAMMDLGFGVMQQNSAEDAVRDTGDGGKTGKGKSGSAATGEGDRASGLRAAAEAAEKAYSTSADALLLFGRLRAVQAAPLTATWDSLAITDRQFCDLWVMYDAEKVSPDWFITWLRMLCATCYFTLPQVVEVLRRFPLQLAFQVEAAALLVPRQIDAYNLHILRRASHPVLWRGCLGRMGLPPWLVHATSLTGRYALNMEVAAERNYAQLLLAEQANRMYDAAGPTPAWRWQADQVAERMLASTPPPLNMNVHNVTWVVPPSARKEASQAAFSSVFPPSPGDSLTFDRITWWKNLWKVGWDAARGLGTPEVPRHGWLVMDMVQFPRESRQVTRLGWGLRPAPEEAGGVSDGEEEAQGEASLSSDEAPAMVGTPLYVEPIASAASPYRLVDNWGDRQRVEARLRELISHVACSGLEQGPLAADIWVKQVLSKDGQEERMLGQLNLYWKDYKKTMAAKAKAEEEAAAAAAEKAEAAKGAKKGAKAAAAAAEAAAAEAALLQSRDEVERSADYSRWALMSRLPPHLAGRYVLETLLMQLEEEAVLMLTYDGVAADHEVFSLHQRHLAPFGLPAQPPSASVEGSLRPSMPPLPAAAAKALPHVVHEVRMAASRRMDAIISSSSIDTQLELLEVHAGSHIVREGDPLTEFLWVEWGWAEVEAPVEGQRNQQAAWEVAPGEFIGTMAVVAGETQWSVNAKSLTDMRVWAIPVAVMAAILEEGLPGLADLLLQGAENRQERAGHAASLLCRGIELRGPKPKKPAKPKKKGGGSRKKKGKKGGAEPAQEGEGAGADPQPPMMRADSVEAQQLAESAAVSEFQAVCFDTLAEERWLSGARASVSTVKLPEIPLPTAVAFGPHTMHHAPSHAVDGHWRSSPKKRGWWRYQMLMGVLEKVRNFSFAHRATCALLAELLKVTSLWPGREKVALMAALLDCVSDLPAFPDLVADQLTTCELMMLGCRLGWLPLSPVNCLEACRKYSLRMWVPHEYAVALRCYKAASRLEKYENFGDMRINGQPVRLPEDAGLWTIMNFGCLGPQAQAHLTQRPARGSQRLSTIHGIPVNERPCELSSNVVEFSFLAPESRNSGLLLVLIRIQSRWRAYTKKKAYLRKLSAQLHAQVFLFRKMRSIYQKQADKVKKQLEELELQKEAKLNRLQLGRHGVQMPRTPDNAGNDETSIRLRKLNHRILHLANKIHATVSRQVIMRMQHPKFFAKDATNGDYQPAAS